MAAPNLIIVLAKDSEDVAAALTDFRDRLSIDESLITAAISELFAVSSVLRDLEALQRDPRFQPGFYRIRGDFAAFHNSLRSTLDAAFDMFARTARLPPDRVWQDLHYRFEREERLDLLGRLELYQNYGRGMLREINGYPLSDFQEMRATLRRLEQGQARTSNMSHRRPIAPAQQSPPPIRPPLQRVETPISPISFSSNEWDHRIPRPAAPEPPMSPAYTSDSSQTLDSSQTSYSADGIGPVPAVTHWAQDIFDGQHPGSTFREGHRSQESSACHGTQDPTALERVSNDRFARVLELPFDAESLWLRLYFRPRDARTRVLVMLKDGNRRTLFFCTHVTNLKCIRDKSSLLLCRAASDGTFSQWARLRFTLYERMVLFYSTFTATKAQDSRPLPHPTLTDQHELHESLVFGGEIFDHSDTSRRQALRIWKDRASGVVRLEACPLRGPKKFVPIWTVFATRYVSDPDWAQYERAGVVSLVAIRPHPYVFVPGYGLERSRSGEYLLRFTTDDDARQFVESWTGLARAH